MLISLLLLILLTAGGTSLTYLIAEDEPLLWRCSAGTIIGSAIFGLISFVAACLVGFSPLCVSISLALTVLPLLLLLRRDTRGQFAHDWAKARGKLDGGNLKKFRAFGFYAFFFLLFWFFFGQVMYETKDGIFTGGSQNLGDLPFHLGAILGFTDGNNFPPQNPSFAGARFSYPFVADLLTACFVKLGADLRSAMFVQNLVWALSLLVILERFVLKLSGNKLAGRLAPALLFFSGGLGFLWFFKDLWDSGSGISDVLWHLPRDYTIGDQFRWGNSMIVLFITQRSLLLGMPLTVMVLGYLWKIFATENTEKDENSVSASPHHRVTASLIIGLLAGMLPLIHLHSLVVLFVVTAFLFVFRIGKWREWVTFGIGVAVVAIPELVWSMTGSASETSKFIGWHIGWDKGDTDIIWFWLKNTGIVLPILGAGIWIYITQRIKDTKDTKAEDQSPKVNSFLLFYVPFAFLFILCNIAKLAPWEWDNIKILIYWYVGSIPLIACTLVRLWEATRPLKAFSALCFIALIFAGALDVWRTASGQSRIKVFDKDAVQIAEQIKAKTAPGALFLNAPTYNSAVVLSGRRSLMRYSGHLASHGINYGSREDDVRRIYEGGGVADILMRKYDIEYVLISPEEKSALQANEEYFKKYPVIAEAGHYKVYKLKN